MDVSLGLKANRVNWIDAAYTRKVTTNQGGRAWCLVLCAWMCFSTRILRSGCFVIAKTKYKVQRTKYVLLWLRA